MVFGVPGSKKGPLSGGRRVFSPRFASGTVVFFLFPPPPPPLFFFFFFSSFSFLASHDHPVEFGARKSKSTQA